MTESHDRLIEHFFRHESANLVAVLTRAFGMRRMDLVEDMVQTAMLEAMRAWKQRGIPPNPAAWIHRVAKHRIMDALRREKTHEKAMALSRQTSRNQESVVDRWLEEDHLPDSLLRMMFVCCHPSLDRKSQIALTLKTLCGFSVAEIARGVMLPHETVKKRIQRAKASLASADVRFDLPAGDELQNRRAVVHEVLYLMFNEGYSTSQGAEPIRDDICEEAARLCHVLCTSPCNTRESEALLALLLFHAARLNARVDGDGAVILLEDQDRAQWDSNLIAAAQHWLMRSKAAQPTRYHLEAAIALQHCIAANVEETNWNTIVRLYDSLLHLCPSPLYILNRAIAQAQTGNTTEARQQLDSLKNCKEMRDYILLDCAFGRIHEIEGERTKASQHYASALQKSAAEHERKLLQRIIDKLSDDS